MILETLPEVQQLPFEDKIRLWEELWEDLIAHESRRPDVHERIKYLEERLAHHQSNAGPARSWDEVKPHLDGADWYH